MGSGGAGSPGSISSSASGLCRPKFPASSFSTASSASLSVTHVPLSFEDTEQRPFPCKFCDARFKKKQHLQNHERIHTGEKYMCILCGQGFSRLHILKHHAYEDDFFRPYVCEICGKRFKLKHHVGQHRRIHTGERPYLCSKCGKSFSQQSNRTVHELKDDLALRFSAGESNWWLPSTSTCPTNPDPEYLLKKHSCPYCLKSFHRRDHLRQHIRVHTGEKPYACPGCGRQFNQRTPLTVHNATEGGRRPFRCSFCGRGFKRVDHKKDHERLHTGEKPYACPFCDAKFPQPSGLRYHKTRQHTGERPYTCQRCGKGFIQLNGLQYHYNNICK
ncbi:UNVERIFIED_CONTAM: hypothetical protein GTU68_020615 [Idotea baltica]|nr:hypothetical protein [Idotea baltica]